MVTEGVGEGEGVLELIGGLCDFEEPLLESVVIEKSKDIVVHAFSYVGLLTTLVFLLSFAVRGQTPQPLPDWAPRVVPATPNATKMTEYQARRPNMYNRNGKREYSTIHDRLRRVESAPFDFV